MNCGQNVIFYKFFPKSEFLITTYFSIFLKFFFMNELNFPENCLHTWLIWCENFKLIVLLTKKLWYSKVMLTAKLAYMYLGKCLPWSLFQATIGISRLCLLQKVKHLPHLCSTWYICFFLYQQALEDGIFGEIQECCHLG